MQTTATTRVNGYRTILHADETPFHDVVNFPWRPETADQDIEQGEAFLSEKSWISSVDFAGANIVLAGQERFTPRINQALICKITGMTHPAIARLTRQPLKVVRQDLHEVFRIFDVSSFPQLAGRLIVSRLVSRTKNGPAPVSGLSPDQKRFLIGMAELGASPAVADREGVTPGDVRQLMSRAANKLDARNSATTAIMATWACDIIRPRTDIYWPDGIPDYGPPAIRTGPITPGELVATDASVTSPYYSQTISMERTACQDKLC